MKRSGSLPRRTPLRTRKPVKRVNVKRRQSEFARCYHSKERVEFVKNLPCVVGLCLHNTFEIENAHIVGDGAGRKASYTKIAPLCHRHHRALHDWGRATFEREYLLDLDRAAAKTERLWLQQQDNEDDAA